MAEKSGRMVTMQLTEKQIRAFISGEKYQPSAMELDSLVSSGLKILMTDPEVMNEMDRDTPIKFSIEFQAHFNQEPNPDGRVLGSTGGIGQSSD